MFVSQSILIMHLEVKETRITKILFQDRQERVCVGDNCFRDYPDYSDYQDQDYYSGFNSRG